MQIFKSKTNNRLMIPLLVLWALCLVVKLVLYFFNPWIVFRLVVVSIHYLNDVIFSVVFRFSEESYLWGYHPAINHTYCASFMVHG